jgi:hypothetical protein
MLAGRIAGLALLGNDLSLTSNAALKLRLNFAAGSLFERISTATGDQHAADRDQDRQGPHPLILGMNFAKANHKRLYKFNGFG